MRIVGANGVLAEGTVKGVGADWKKFEVTLKGKNTDPNAKLVVTAASAGTLWLDMVSLIPAETFKNHGLRLDLAQMIANMNPKFVRFPGGCVVEGDPVIENAVRWKKSIGPVEERVGHWDLWGYWSNEGLGYHEFLQFCEDIKAEPMYVINCGMSHKEERAQKETPGIDVQEFIQDALDAIEYANGPVDSKWGALRAKAGHPKPFKMKFMEIGNENGGKIYHERYAKFREAIMAKYPDMRLIACDWRGGTPQEELLDIVDEHYYSDPGFFMRETGKYDKYDRKRHKVYVGEYAVTKSCGKGNLIAGVGEAAFMTGMERNSDIVEMASYAPLFVNPAWEAWNPNAIVFDASRTYGTPSYYVQTMFGNNKPDVILPLELVSAATTQQTLSGGIGVGSWGTQTEYKDIQVTGPDGSTLFQSSEIKDMSAWKTDKGQWEVKDGLLKQANADTPALALLDGKSFGNCTLTLKARKTGGSEGFLVLFQSTNLNDRTWWNIGGWENKQSGLEGGDLPDEKKNISIETGRWYDLKVEMDGQRVKCSVDGKIIHDVSRSASKSLFAVAGRKKDTNEVIVKVVNGGAIPQDASLELTGIKSLASTGKAIVLTSEKSTDENSFAEPTKVAPKEEKLEGVSATMQHTFPPYSVTVLRLQEKK
ncbi:TPA: alpha-L-arabinofuranosidase [Candidatus Sumerlaeota bacterium]|nr:alpha-L-arabinofuranosidase [Candidatus Sumerlaeota bacterium]